VQPSTVVRFSPALTIQILPHSIKTKTITSRGPKMPITQQEIDTIRRIILDGAKTHFPPSVQFHDTNVTVHLDADDEEFFHVRLLYTAPNPVLDGYLMGTLFRVTDEPIRAAGITARALVTYTDINDPTWPQYRKSPTPPSPAS